MNILYNIGMSLYSTAVKIVAVRNPKARLMVEGRKQTWKVLREKIDPDKKYVWIHVSSLGEFEQGRPLIEMIKQHTPDKKILLTFFSPSGYEVCKNYNLADAICYLPFDRPSDVKRFFKSVDIEKAVFVKYEFWGNFLQELKRRGIPTYIISAIFRPSQMFFKPYGGMFRNMLKCYTTLFVQDKNSVKLLAGIGIKNVVISGDTRFDRVTDILDNHIDLPVVESFTRSRFSMVAGSTWEPDEDIIVSHFNRTPEMKLIIAPHELWPERIESLLSKIKRPVVKYTEATPEQAAEADCLIIDCYGILSKIYRYAAVAYIGGGFGVGIHNINEAAVYGIPVIFGPNYHKFKEACDMIRLGGAFSIDGKDAYEKTIGELLSDGKFLSLHGDIAGRYIKENIGATRLIYTSIFH